MKVIIGFSKNLRSKTLRWLVSLYKPQITKFENDFRTARAGTYTSS